MTTFRAFRSRFWGSLSKRRHDARLSEEIQTHLDLLIGEHVARGMSPAEARIEALREFGGIEYVKDQTRDERGLPFVESLLQDARFALRQLRRNPSFAITAILTLAIGIGGTTAIFSVLDVVAFRPYVLPESRSAGRPRGNAAAVRPLSRQRSRHGVLAQRVQLVRSDCARAAGLRQPHRTRRGGTFADGPGHASVPATVRRPGRTWPTVARR